MATNQYSVLGKAPGSDELKKLSQDDVCLTIKKLRAYNRLSKKSVIYPGTNLRITPTGG